MNTADKVHKMIALQAKMNALVHPEWKTQNFNWHRAAYVEAIELLEHHGQWRWWKSGQKDLQQMQYELVDIWHFMMSSLMTTTDSDEVVTSLLLPMPRSESGLSPNNDYDELIDKFVADLAGNKRFNVPVYHELLKRTEMDMDDLYRMYIAKNTLNTFRQHNGYKDGSYQKIWDGKEDNEVLAEILPAIDADDTLGEALYSALSERYKLTFPAEKYPSP